ncbi:hypothetical protein Q0F99_19050 [Rathayibacter oskolensis]|uniref:hypothetical protein n=1 Tax=Rathayibacter oskolensis TaxID=1891671 RepID=UPI00265DDD3F|nr:hypothetical protein [Rathayibacter oskolensis]WKK71438.1 hypothetical protein Q0F99_19050 [Rathayibacter oskolensis]
MIGLSVILMVRLVPYAFTAVLATRKGYKWLTAFAVYLMAAAVVNVVFDPGADTRGLIATGSSVLLLLHVLDLKHRKEGKSDGHS